MFHRSKYFIHPLLYCETFFSSAPLVCLVTSIHILISVERQPRSQQSIFVATARTDGESDKKSEVETVRRRLRHRLHRASEVTELCSLYYFIRRFPLSISTMFFFSFLLRYIIAWLVCFCPVCMCVFSPFVGYSQH